MMRTCMTSFCALVLAALAAGQSDHSEHSTSSSSSSSATRRVIVVNGKTVVDEATKDGRSVPPPAPAAGEDAGAMKQRLLEELFRDLPPDARRLLEGSLRDAAGSKTQSSHSRRVVVRNGEVIVDEEVRDGVPVPRSERKPAGDRPAAKPERRPESPTPRSKLRPTRSKSR